MGFSRPRRQEGPSSAHDDKKRAPLLAWLLLDTSTMVEASRVRCSGCDRPPPTKPTVSPSAPWNYLILHQMSIWILLIDNHVLFFFFSIAITSHAPCFTFTFLWGYSRIPANCEFVTICTSLHKNIQPVSTALEWLGWRSNTIATVTTYYTVK